jgi:hypothetical protein
LTHAGSCRCGLISAEIAGDPVWRSYCHCRDCRKQTGAPVMAFVGFRAEAIEWSGEPQTWRSGGVERSFCAHCGSQIGYRDDHLPGLVYLALGFMDEPESYPPAFHAFESRRLPFFQIADHLPRHETFGPDRKTASME